MAMVRVVSGSLRAEGRRSLGAVPYNSAFHSSGVGKSSTGLLGWGEDGACSLVSGGR